MPAVKSVKVGDRVLAPPSSFTWRERMVVSAAGLSALPPDADPQQLAMLAINPPTAALLLSEYVDLKPGEWVVQNAANSGVGRWVIAFAKKRGLKTVNLVRRPELVAELEQSRVILNAEVHHALWDDILALPQGNRTSGQIIPRRVGHADGGRAAGKLSLLEHSEHGPHYAGSVRESERLCENASRVRNASEGGGLRSRHRDSHSRLSLRD